MPRLPDRFDLFLRKARECSDEARQVDYVLGALIGLKDWWLPNVGTNEKPMAAKTEIEGDLCVLIFSTADRADEFTADKEGFAQVISIPSPAALKWCSESGVGLILNPDEESGTVLIPHDQVKAFHDEWSQRGGRQTAGFWIPNMTTEEEDFWQANGL